MEENQFNTGGIVSEETIEEIRKFIRQTDGFILSKEQSDKIIELVSKLSSGNIEISMPKL